MVKLDEARLLERYGEGGDTVVMVPALAALLVEGDEVVLLDGSSSIISSGAWPHVLTEELPQVPHSIWKVLGKLTALTAPE